MNRRKFLKILGVVSSSLAALPVIAKPKEVAKSIGISNNAKDSRVYVGGVEVKGTLDGNGFTIDDPDPGHTRATLYSKLLCLPGVTQVNIIENELEHSIECIVRGGEDQDIATCIYSYKSMGILTLGQHYHSITTSFGSEYIIRFSRF